MLKFASTILLKPVLSNNERALIGILEELAIDPANGKLVGVLVREGLGKKSLKVVSEKDILVFGEGFVLIPSVDVVGEIDEIVRVKNVIDQETKIIHNKVFTVSGSYLGKVSDYILDFPPGILAKIIVTPGIFSLKGLSSDLIIAYEQIVCIEKDKITVEDASLKAEGKVKKRIGETEAAS